MASKYQESQRSKAIKLIENENPIFDGGKLEPKLEGKTRASFLSENLKNIFAPIRKDVVEYSKYNSISWWRGNKPSGHVLSSQIACFNHLFHLRNDKDAVLTILNNVSNNFIDVLRIETDKYLPAFIQFESISDTDHLNEKGHSRGANCTSIDALIYAVHNDGSNWLIPIEWKYTEYYNNQDKSGEGFKEDPIGCKGEQRKKSYTQLINESSQLKSDNHKCYYYEPFIS
jgi:hypothetical protein